MSTLLQRIFSDFEREDYEASQAEAYEKSEADKAYRDELAFIETAFEDAVCLKYNVDARAQAAQYVKERFEFENQETY